MADLAIETAQNCPAYTGRRPVENPDRRLRFGPGNLASIAAHRQKLPLRSRSISEVHNRAGETFRYRADPILPGHAPECCPGKPGRGIIPH